MAAAIDVRTAVLGLIVLLCLGAGLAVWIGAAKTGRLKVSTWSGGSMRWDIADSDFVLFFFSVLAWFLFTGAWASATDFSLLERIMSEELAVAIASGLMLQLGLMAIGSGFMRFTPSRSGSGWEPPSTRRLPRTQLFAYTVLGTLAIYPLIMLASSLRYLLTEALMHTGIDLELDGQWVVRIIQESGDPVGISLLVFIAVILAPIAEEMVFRGNLHRFLRGRNSMPVAVMLSSCLFAVLHFNLPSFFGLLAVGAALALLYEMTGDLRIPVLVHSLYNASQIVLLLNLPKVPPAF